MLLHPTPHLRILMISEKDVFAVLPENGFLRSYVDWAGKWLPSNMSFHVPAALALLAQTVPAEMRFPGITELRANIFALLVGPSSISGKTRAIETARSILKGALPEGIMVSPGSPEACMDALTGSPQILFYNEFGTFLSGTERGQLAPLRMLLTDLYDCTIAGRDLVKRRRSKKGKPPEQNPRLSILAGVTPGLLENYTTDIDWTEGFLGRFFTMYASSERDSVPRDFAGRGEEERLELIEILRSYLLYRDIFHPDPAPCGGFATGADHVWDDWQGQLRERAQSGERAIRAAIHRAQAHAIKIALLLSWDYGAARTGDPWRVEAGVLKTAISITELHIASVVEIAEGLAPDRDGRDERKMYQAIDENGIEYGMALKKAHLIKERGDKMITSLLEKKLITRVADSDVMAPVRYMRVKQDNVIKFPPKSVDELF